MQNWIQAGDTIALTAPYARTSGQGALVGRIFGVAADDVANGAVGQFVMKGVVDLAKDASTFTDGSLVYWDNTAKVATSTVGSNKIIGVALMVQPDGTSALGALTGDATVRLVIRGITVLA